MIATSIEQKEQPAGKLRFSRGMGVTIQLIIACLAATAGILYVSLFSHSSGMGTGKLVINEVVASNRYALTDESLGTPDWIELYNGSNKPINLAGYGLTNNAKDFRKFTFPAVVLGAGEYLIVYACDTPAGDAGGALTTGFNISRSGELLFLSDAYAGLIQQLEVPELYSDVSYARSASGAYGFTSQTTPGAPNDDASIRASLAQLLGASAGSLVLNEVVPYASDGLPWAELYNPSDEAIQLSGYFLSDHPDEPLRFCLPGYVLKPQGYALIYFSSFSAVDGDDLLMVDFRLGRGETMLQLTSAGGELQSALAWSADHPSDIAAVRSADGVGIAVPTPLAENTSEVWTFHEPAAMDASDVIVISEVMPANRDLFPDGDGDTSEWAEIYNRSGAAVSLLGYYLSDDPAAPARYALPDQMLDAGGYLVVWLSGKNTSSGELHANFSLSAGEALTLTNLPTMRQDIYAIDGTCPKNASFSRAEDGSYLYYGTPTPGYANAKPYSLPGQVGWFNSGGVFISEVFAAGNAAKGDWVELCNGASQAAALDGWCLSDDPRNPQKMRLSGVTIPAGGYAVLDLSKGGESPGLGISSGGDILYLFEPDGRPADIFSTGVLSAGATSGRIVSDEMVARAFFARSTRGAANTKDVYSGYAAAPVFSETGLYHEKPFFLVMHATSADATIRYTTNGSNPTKNSPVYTGAIEVSKDCVVRAAAFQQGLLSSAYTSATYLFSKPHTVPVVCVAADPEELNPVLKTTQRKNKPECAADLAYYDESGVFCAGFRAGLRAKGRSMLKYSQKSFSVKLRGRYGQTSVSYPFFESHDVLSYSAFSLRNGGQDRGRARLRDSYFLRLAEDLSIENIRTRVVALYLNGSFYGVYDLNEEQDESYLASHYGVDANAVDIINRNDEVKAGTADEFLRIRSFAIERDLSDDAVYEQFCEWVDVAYFTDYLVFRSYISDMDLINQAYWRSQDYTVKWRPILFDLDYALYGNQHWQSYKKDALSQYFSERGIPSANKSKTYVEIYIGLKKNAGWRRQFVARYIELMNTSLSPENMLMLLDEMDDDYLAEMPRQVETVGFPSSISSTLFGLEQLRDAIKRRPAYALEYLKRSFPDEADYIDELLRAYG